jgi:hypothetical protein
VSRRHRPFDIVYDVGGTWIVSRKGRYRRWSPKMMHGLARLRRQRSVDDRIFAL